MSEELVWSPQGTLHRADGLRFDGWDWRWTEGVAVDSGEVLLPTEAMRRLMRAGARRIPVGVIGPRQATPAQEATAEALGRALGDLGLPACCAAATAAS
jgi:histone H3/H4